MLPAVRWNIAVSPDTDRSVRRFIESQDGDRKDGLSRFIKEAVRSHFLELTPKQAKAANTDVSEQNLTSMAEEAVRWARISVSTLAAPG